MQIAQTARIHDFMTLQIREIIRHAGVQALFDESFLSIVWRTYLRSANGFDQLVFIPFSRPNGVSWDCDLQY